MKKRLFFLLFIPTTFFAQTVAGLFDAGNVFYKEGHYEEALQSYQQILSQDQESSEVYFNIGNCYYQLNKVAPSIYNYEKSLRLNPSHKAAKDNLNFANRLALDTIDTLPITVFQEISSKYLMQFSYNTWGLLAIVFSSCFVWFFLRFYFAESPLKKRSYFIASLFTVLFCVSSLGVAYQQYSEKKTRIEAIVFEEKTEVQNAPTKNSEIVFTLHEGTKIQVLDIVDSWKKIKLADGETGWISGSHIKEL